MLLAVLTAWGLGQPLQEAPDLVYWLGVAGGSLMLTLFAYPLRKRWKPLRRVGSTRGWFIFHMVTGIVGPWLVLVHCGLRIGSTNAAVALISMLVVVASGVVGRYLYAHVHRGWDGRMTELAEVRERLQTTHDRLLASFSLAPEVHKHLLAFEETALAMGRQGPLQVLLRTGRLEAAARPKAFALIDQALAEADGLDESRRRRARKGWRHLTRLHMAQTLEAARWQAWERLFAWWHVAHLPFVVVMVLCALVHVVAVHAY